MAAKRVVKKAQPKSIQAEANTRGHKRSHVAQLNDRTLQTATRHGLRWDDEDVELLVGMIEEDTTTFDMAVRLQRSFYSAQVARSHIGFVMRHQAAFERALARTAAPKKRSRR